MSLYPSLEDMKVDTMARAQMAQPHVSQYHAPQYQAPPPYAQSPASGAPSAPRAHVYPALGDYMGLELSADVIAQNMPEYRVQTVSTFVLLIHCHFIGTLCLQSHNEECQIIYSQQDFL